MSDSSSSALWLAIWVWSGGGFAAWIQLRDVPKTPTVAFVCAVMQGPAAWLMEAICAAMKWRRAVLAHFDAEEAASLGEREPSITGERNDRPSRKHKGYHSDSVLNLP